MAGLGTVAASVQLSLSTDDSNPSKIPFPERQIVLDSANNSVTVGRASKTSSKGFLAEHDNAWFDSAVMSRQHAKITADLVEKKVELRDLGSLHGTYLNSDKEKLVRDQPRQLKDGDHIRFGVPVWRGADTFAPTTVKVGIIFNHREEQKGEGEGTTTFKVPDPSEDGSDSDDYSSEIDAENRTGPTAKMPGLPAPVVDLTTDFDDDDLPEVREVIDLSTPPPETPIILDDDDEEEEDDDDYDIDDDGHPDYTRANIARLCQSAIQLSDSPAPRYSSTIPAAIVYETKANYVATCFGDYMDNTSEYDQDQDSIRLSTDEEDNSSSHDNDDESMCSDTAEGYLFDREASYSSQRSTTSDFEDDLDEVEMDQDEMMDASDSEAGSVGGPFIYDDSSDEDAPSSPFWRPALLDPVVTPHATVSHPEMPGHASGAHREETTPCPVKATLPITICGLLNDDKSEPSPPQGPQSPELSQRQSSPSDVAMLRSFSGDRSDLSAAIARAQVLGEKTGKLDFFVAREENKHLISTIRKEQIECQNVAEHSQPAPLMITAIAPPLCLSEELSAFQHPHESISNAAMGTKDDIINQQAQSSTNVNATDSTRRTYLGISDIVEGCQKRADSGKGKRKADDICETTAEEEHWATSPAPISPAPSTEMELSSDKGLSEQAKSTLDASVPEPATEAVVEGTLNSEQGTELAAGGNAVPELVIPAALAAEFRPATVAENLEQRASKRRRVSNLSGIAEKIRYAALGGLATSFMIVGTLIYTAPTFDDIVL